MFTRIDAPALSESQLYTALHPELSRWFKHRFAHFSPAQLHAVPEILAGQSLLLTSPTGSGKTLAAFLSVFDFLARAHDSGELPNGIVAVYVSPLRALAYDLRKNLQQPAEELGWAWLRIGARTGDTTPKERAVQRRKPPDIFVTTPESLTLMLSQPAWIAAFKSVRFFIADELHALAENKRGAMLMVAAERLEEVVGTPLQGGRETRREDRSKDGSESRPDQNTRLTRIGLSATISPLETIAEFLVGPGRPCRIVEITQSKPAKIEVFSPLRDRAYPPAGYTATRV
ncbi:MAG TPA: DEAD/DEAH box helicase, partial [Opitutus sp.]|nr:DEAD/DEAH box helicase [Opitutus sp.]